MSLPLPLNEQAPPRANGPEKGEGGRKQDALQRLLDIKGPVRSRQVRETAPPFLEALEEALAAMEAADEGGTGWLDGSISGRCWHSFMEQVRGDLLNRLQAYRDTAQSGEFQPATLNSLREERRRIERLYIRDLVGLYQQAAQQYKSLSG